MINLERLYYSTFQIEDIHFKVFSTQLGIKRIYLNNEDVQIENADVTKLHPDDPYMFNIHSELNEYFNDRRKVFSVPLNIEGSDFQKLVWKEVLKIPFGKTITYRQLSIRIGDEKSIRAVGKANSQNPLPILIPCHRVIGNGGKLVGYSGGLKIKEKLLELEGVMSLQLFN
jgi:methylated-DNA-[protein]-cysteine S-methyltransferase